MLTIEINEILLVNKYWYLITNYIISIYQMKYQNIKSQLNNIKGTSHNKANL